MCVSEYGFEGDDHGEGNATIHVITGSALVLVLALKVVVVRWWHGLGRLLPLLGTAVLILLGVTWLTSAAGILT